MPRSVIIALVDNYAYTTSPYAQEDRRGVGVLSLPPRLATTEDEPGAQGLRQLQERLLGHAQAARKSTETAAIGSVVLSVPSRSLGPQAWGGGSRNRIGPIGQAGGSIECTSTRAITQI